MEKLAKIGLNLMNNRFGYSSLPRNYNWDEMGCEVDQSSRKNLSQSFDLVDWSISLAIYQLTATKKCQHLHFLL